MTPDEIIHTLSKNAGTLYSMLEGISEEEYTWSSGPDSWSILEILCHLRDEEKEDFRARIRCILNEPPLTPKPINPEGWVHERKYFLQSFEEVLASFLREREGSVLWLHSLDQPDWDRAWDHPSLGLLSARHFLHNWLAHDYLHIRQITKVRYDYLKSQGKLPIDYAGTWK